MPSQSPLWLPCTQMQTLKDPLNIVRGSGALLFDDQGNSLIDGISSWWVNLHGHCHPHIGAAITKQLGTLEHTLLGGVTHEPALKLAAKLIEKLPGFDKVFFADSGSAAVESALKMSLQFWHQSGQTSKNTFVSLQHGYHGETLGSLAVTDIPLFTKQYAPLLINHKRVPSPADIFCPAGLTQSEHEQQALQKLESLLEAEHNQVCALILEPLMQGAAGMGFYSVNYLESAVALCRRYGVHVIFDEIATGFGRTGKLFALDYCEAKPDFVCLSKGLTAGYLPMSAVVTTESIYQAFLDTSLERAFLHSHSYSGNPLGCAAALASLEVFDQDQVLVSNKDKSTRIEAGFEQLRQLPGVSRLRGLGMVWAITLTHPQVSSAQLGLKVAKLARDRGLLIRPIGNQLYLMPPYCITSDQLELVFAILQEACCLALQEEAPAGYTHPSLLA